MCGESLPDRTPRAKSSKPGAAAIVPPTTRVVDTPQSRHSEKWVEAPAGPANPVIPESERNPRALVDSLAERRPHNRYESEASDVRQANDVGSENEDRRGRPEVFSGPSSGSSSPSFLGLGSADYEPPQREISWRFWALMLVLLGVVALFGLQWRANRLRAEQSKPDAAQSGVSQPSPQSSPGTDPQNSDMQKDGATSGADVQSKQDPAAPASTADQPQNKTTNDKATKDKTATPSSTETPDQSQPKTVTPKSPKAAAAKSSNSSADANGADASDSEISDSAAGDNNGGEAAQPPSQKPAREASLREASDAPVNQADSLIASGDCNGAVRTLRAAGANPRALTKLGAMYLTGTCVEPDRVTAYAWFSQAFNSDPHNLRLESTRRMIWRQMSDDERAKVEQGFQAR